MFDPLELIPLDGTEICAVDLTEQLIYSSVLVERRRFGQLPLIKAGALGAGG